MISTPEASISRNRLSWKSVSRGPSSFHTCAPNTWLSANVAAVAKCSSSAILPCMHQVPRKARCCMDLRWSASRMDYWARNRVHRRQNRTTKMAGLPLERFTVLDLTLHRAGPTCARQFADWGARVIKIEVPGGPKGEATGANRLGPDYQNLHRNKLNMTLNLKSDEGRAIFLDLAKSADVVIENYRSHVKHRLRIDYEAVAKV